MSQGHSGTIRRIEGVKNAKQYTVPVEAARLAHWRKTAATNKDRLRELLHRELRHTGLIDEESSYSAELLALVRVEGEERQ